MVCKNLFQKYGDVVISDGWSPGELETAGELLGEAGLRLPGQFTPWSGPASLKTLAHKARIFEKGIEASFGSWNVFIHLQMSYPLLISLSSELEMAGLTSEPFGSCLGKKIQY